MQMFTLWMVEYPGARPARLEDEDGPVLFSTEAAAAACAQREAEWWEAPILVCPIRVGQA
jgi:hypothetical protein